jgi:agmatinase
LQKQANRIRSRVFFPRTVLILCVTATPFGFLAAPYERTTSFMEGTALAPEAFLREWERLSCRGELPLPEAIFQLPPAALSGVRNMLPAVHEATAAVAERSLLPVMLGGEHTVTIGAVAALSELVEDLGVVQLDAHADLRSRYGGSRFSHACAMRRIREDLNLPVLPVGIRAWSRGEEAMLRSSSTGTLPARDLCRWRKLLPPLLERLPGSVYLTLDMDFFDPSVAPGVGTPEPGGATWYQGMGVIEEICRRKKVVGVDVVELCPRREVKISVRAAVRAVAFMLDETGKD